MSLKDLRLKSWAFRICSQVLPEPALSPSCKGVARAKEGGNIDCRFISCMPLWLLHGVSFSIQHTSKGEHCMHSLVDLQLPARGLEAMVLAHDPPSDH
jgi:hypothetical protein